MGKSNCRTHFNYRAAVILASVAILMMFCLTCTAPEPQQPTPQGERVAITLEMTLEQLVAKADWILTGNVTAIEAKKDSQSGNINTFVTIKVDEWIKGNPVSGSVIIKVPGGEVGDVTQWVEDAPGFSSGEKVLVYLTPNNDGTASMVGGSQGKLVTSGGSSGRNMSKGGSVDEQISRIKSIIAQTNK